MERVMAQLASDFAIRENTEVHLVLFGRKRDIQYSVSDAVIIHRPKFIFNNKRRGWYTLKTMFFLRKEIKRINPDAVLGFGELWNNLVLLALLKLRISIFVSDRYKPDKSFGFIQDKLRHWL